MFRDRSAAGLALADRLRGRLDPDALLLALPRGGLPVAAEVARALGLALDVMLVRKVGFPGHEELALAAVAGPAGEALVVNEEVAAAAGLGPEAVERLAAPQREEIRRRRALWLGDRPAPDMAGRTAVLVDDGVATGATMRAAIRALRGLRPARIVVAVPVAPPDTLAALRAEADAVVCLEAPHHFRAVGAHYLHFPQVSDAEARAILAAFRRAEPHDGDPAGA